METATTTTQQHNVRGEEGGTMCVTFGITLSHFPDADADSDSDPDSDPDRGGLSGLRFGSFQFGSVRFAWFGGRSRAGLSGRHLEPLDNTSIDVHVVAGHAPRSGQP